MVTFKRLCGLPAYDEMAISFPKPGSFREGVVFEFTMSGGNSWVGNFDPGYRTSSVATGVYPELGAGAVFVLADGRAYKINAVTKELIEEISRYVVWIGYFAPLEIMVVCDDLEVVAYTRAGVFWRSERVSWDGIEYVSIRNDRLFGQAYDPMDDRWLPFEIDLATGLITGGSYLAN
ncbi:hypothetical protein O8B38_08115 [Agrobacterium rhizogenes]|nr:hypothetical protein [Rhizobium rhizogenes]